MITYYFISQNIPSIVGVTHDLSRDLWSIPHRQAEGDQLGYVEFTDAASASAAITQYNGYLGLGGRGLALEPTPYTLAQLTGQPASDSSNVNAAPPQKRQREDGEFIITANGCVLRCLDAKKWNLFSHF